MRGALLVCVLFVGTAHAQGVGIPSSRWGLGFGNSPEFSGLRFNFRDHAVKRLTGINLTLWSPSDENTASVVSGISLGPLPGGGVMRGLQLGLFGIVAMRSMAGISIAPLGLGAGEEVLGLNLAGVGMGAGKRLIGVNVATLGLGAGEDVLGVTVVGLGAGAGERMIGLNLAGLALGAGRTLGGLSVAGLAMGAGGALDGISVAGLALGAPKVRGLAVAVGVVGGQHLTGVMLAGASVHAIEDGSMTGLAISAFNYIRGRQTGVSIGIVNYAWSVRGLQLGVINIVRDNPLPLKVLPVLNTSF